MELRDTSERKTATIRLTTKGSELPMVMGKTYGEIMHFFETHQITPAGPPFSLYHNMDMDNLDVEIGFPVDGEIPEDDRVKLSVLPAGRAAVEIHRGPYDTLEETYNRLIAFLQEQGLEMGSYMYEFYVNDPGEVPPEEIETEVYTPVKE